MEQLLNLYQSWSGVGCTRAEKLAGAGSNRQYYRLSDAEGNTVIGCIGTSADENHAFVQLGRHFAAKGLPVPEVLAVSRDETRYLQQDLGATSLFDALRRGREAGGSYDAQERGLLRQAISQLPRLQFVGAQQLDFSVCYPQPSFDRTGVMFDLNYFKYCYLKATGIDFHELLLERDFRLLADHLTAEDAPTFLYRDFQARNVMLHEGTPYFIDFQGGRRGPVYYDLASFLWQASARYPQALRQELVDLYYETALQYAPLPERKVFDSRLRLFVFFRLLQVLGAYGFRGYFERKKHFIDSIPPALDNLRQLLDGAAPDDFPYPALTAILRQLLPDRQPSAPSANADKAANAVLTIQVYSFSFKRGIPPDESGHGGGYVFDCRGTHNPGRYEQYKQLTGLDEPVIRFLEEDGEILRFLESVYSLADTHVARYLERGFTHLMFSFGCTGGRHRSVYSAQHLADHLHRKFPQVEVLLTHREQDISRCLPPAAQHRPSV